MGAFLAALGAVLLFILRVIGILLLQIGVRDAKNAAFPFFFIRERLRRQKR